jgi:hypothetical protein
MNTEGLILITKGTIKHLPGVKKLLSPLKTGGTGESRYCYSVWLRHLKNWSRFRENVPVSVAELGPGDSLGTGIAALLSGARHYYALDAVKYWDNEKNLQIFEELVGLFMQRSAMPADKEYPKARPKPDNYAFPSGILTDSLLQQSLAAERLNAIRKELSDINNPENSFIRYKIPWHESSVIDNGSIDFIYSQAVLECIEDLDNTFDAMHKWLRGDGLISHTIDLKCHGLTREWNGHWRFSEIEWYLVKGGRSFLINRKPASKYRDLLYQHGFIILDMQNVKMNNRIPRNELAAEFRNMTEEDLTTSGMYILARKR